MCSKAPLFSVRRIWLGTKDLRAEIVLSDDAPCMTSEDRCATQRIQEVLPGLAGHYCAGDKSSRFGDVIGDTELAHLLEHVVVELLALSDVAGDVVAGKTYYLGDRRYCVMFSCNDQALTKNALRAGIDIMTQAYVYTDTKLNNVDSMILNLRGV